MKHLSTLIKRVAKIRMQHYKKYWHKRPAPHMINKQYIWKWVWNERVIISRRRPFGLERTTTSYARFPVPCIQLLRSWRDNPFICPTNPHKCNCQTKQTYYVTRNNGITDKYLHFVSGNGMSHRFCNGRKVVLMGLTLIPFVLVWLVWMERDNCYWY